MKPYPNSSLAAAITLGVMGAVEIVLVGSFLLYFYNIL